MYRLAVDPVLLTSVNKQIDLLSPRPRGPIEHRDPLVLEPLLPRADRVDAGVLLEEALWWLERRVYPLALHAARDAARLGAVEAEEVAREASRLLGVELHAGSRKD